MTTPLARQRILEARRAALRNRLIGDRLLPEQADTWDQPDFIPTLHFGRLANPGFNEALAATLGAAPPSAGRPRPMDFVRDPRSANVVTS